jgi:DnaD/phage-associated family protein
LSNLLINESPILVLPSLATKVGLSEAIFIQQLHYWLKDSKNVRDGYKWVYNTYEDWHEQFPWWSISTIRRIITKLENSKLLIIGNYNRLKIDNTKWYRIDYELLEHMNRPPVQIEQTECSERADEMPNLNRPLPEITSKITSEKEKEEEKAGAPVNAFRFFEENGFGTIGGHISEKIIAWINDLSEELVLEALKIAVEYGAKNWSYVERILVSWTEKKITSVEQVHALILAHKEKQSKQKQQYTSRPNTKSNRKEVLPDWFDKKDDDPPPEPNADLERRRRELQAKLKKYRSEE